MGRWVLERARHSSTHFTHSSTPLAQALLHVGHDAGLAGVFALGGSHAAEVNFAGESKVLLDLIFTGHGDTSSRNDRENMN